VKLPQLLTNVQRERLNERIHRVRIKRLVFGTILIGLGSVIPEFHPLVLHAIASDGVKSVGFLPLLKLVEDLVC